jgi:hypothetical protein
MLRKMHARADLENLPVYHLRKAGGIGRVTTDLGQEIILEGEYLLTGPTGTKILPAWVAEREFTPAIDLPLSDEERAVVFSLRAQAAVGEPEELRLGD